MLQATVQTIHVSYHYIKCYLRALSSIFENSDTESLYTLRLSDVQQVICHITCATAQPQVTRPL